MQIWNQITANFQTKVSNSEIDGVSKIRSVWGVNFSEIHGCKIF